MSSKETRIFYDTDADPARLQNRVVAVIGYGSQGHAHALNLRDSGVGARVIVGLRPGGASWERARAEDLDVRPVAEAARAADVIMMLVPDQEARAVYEAGVAPALQRGKTLLFAHGFNIHFHEIVPPAGVDVAMIAPKSPGHLVRSEFQAGRGVPALVAVHQDASGNALADALAYAAGIGCARAGVFETTFREETETDLFGEQTVLCGGVTALIQAGFETLTAAGYAPEIAYFECMHELKLIVDLMYRGGMKFMRYSISDTAEYGDYTRGPKVITPEVHAAMQRILADIQSGSFAREWIAESRSGGRRFEALRKAGAEHPIEQVGAKLRAMMPWTEEGNARDFGLELFDLRSPQQGIVHVIGPELGLTQPGMVIVCGDSHTATHGAFGALALGIGTSEVEHVLATQCLVWSRPGTMEARVTGTLAPGVTAKDLILALIGRIGTAGATGHVIEYTGEAIRALSMEERMTVCNMSIEAGARAGLIAPDETTVAYLAGRPRAPHGAAWTRAVEQWKRLRSDPGAEYDVGVALDAAAVAPQVTWGTSPGMVKDITGRVPRPSDFPAEAEQRAPSRAGWWTCAAGRSPTCPARWSSRPDGAVRPARRQGRRAAAGQRRHRPDRSEAVPQAARAHRLRSLPVPRLALPARRRSEPR